MQAMDTSVELDARTHNSLMATRLEHDAHTRNACSATTHERDQPGDSRDGASTPLGAGHHQQASGKGNESFTSHLLRALQRRGARAPCRCAEPLLPRRPHTPLAGARAAPAPSLTRTPCRGPPTHLTPCAAPGPARGGDSQHVAPAPCSVLQPAAPLAAVRPGCCAAGRLPSSQPSS